MGNNIYSITEPEILSNTERNVIVDKHFLYGFPENLESIIGRDETAKNLLEIIKTNKRIVITGLGGSGKTALALHCAATWVPHQYAFAAIMDMETQQTAKSSFIGLARRLNLPIYNEDNNQQIIRDVYDRFKSTSLLIVFDNMQPQNFYVSDFLPAKTRKNIAVLGTSEYTQFKVLFHCHELELLSKESSVDLMESILNCSNHRIKLDDMLDLVNKLGRSPLTLIHATSYIRNYKIFNDKEYTVNDYLNVFDEQLKKQFSPKYENQYEKIVYAALKLNIDNCVQNIYARRILSCMAYMNPNDIREDVFLNLSHFSENNVKEAYIELSKHSIITKERRKMRNTLCQYIKIHRVLLGIYRLCLNVEQSDFQKEAKLSTFELLIKMDDPYPHYEFLLPYMDEMLISKGYKVVFSTGKLHNQLKNDLQRVGCDISATEHWEALHYAEYCSHREIINELEKEAMSFRNIAIRQWSPLHAAMLNGKDSLDLSTKYKEILNLQTESGLTALHIAAATGCERNVQRLVDCKCEVNLPDDAGNTAIHWAMKYSHCNIVRIVINSGVKENKKIIASNDMNFVYNNFCLACQDFEDDKEDALEFWNPPENVKFHTKIEFSN